MIAAWPTASASWPRKGTRSPSILATLGGRTWIHLKCWRARKWKQRVLLRVTARKTFQRERQTDRGDGEEQVQNQTRQSDRGQQNEPENSDIALRQLNQPIRGLLAEPQDSRTLDQFTMARIECAA